MTDEILTEEAKNVLHWAKSYFKVKTISDAILSMQKALLANFAPSVPLNKVIECLRDYIPANCKENYQSIMEELIAIDYTREIGHDEP